MTQKGNAHLGLGQFDEAKECYESLRTLADNSTADQYLKKLHDIQEKDSLYKLDNNKIYCYINLDKYLNISFQNQQPNHVKRRKIKNKYMEGFDANTNLEPSFSYALPKTIYTDNKFLTQFSTAQNTASLIITTNKQLTPVIVSD